MDIKKGSYTKKSPAGLTWFNNVGKSLGYTSQELVTSIAPSIGEFISTNKDFVQDSIKDIREFKTSGGRLDDALKNNTTLSIGQTALKNAMSDIKSGKIYNKERQEAQMNEAFGFDDFGDDDSFGMIDLDLDDDMSSDFGDDDNDSSPKVVVPKVTVNVPGTNINKNNPMVKAIEQNSRATLVAAESQMTANQALTTTTMMFNQKLGDGVITGLQTMNSNIGLLVNFQNDSMTKYIGASIKYYEDSLGVLNGTLSALRGDKKDESRQNDDPDIFLSGGGLDLENYKNSILKNLKDQVESNMFMAPIKSMLEDSDMMKQLAASPLSFLSTKIVTTLLPTFFQKSLEQLNESFESFFPAMMMRMNVLKDSSNPILSFMGEVFGVKTKAKTSLDLSQYERGAIPFDGETKKSITEIIPGYLRKILSAVSGQEEVAFDANTGKFRSLNDMQKEYDNNLLRKAERMYSDAFDLIKSNSEAFQFEDRKEQDTFENEMKKFFLKLSGQTKLINPYIRQDKDGFDVDDLRGVYDFNGNEGFLELFRESLLRMPNKDIRKLFGADTLNANKEITKFYEEMENNPLINNASTLFNGLTNVNQKLSESEKKKQEIKDRNKYSAIDKFGKTSMDYLRDLKEIMLKGIKVFPVYGMKGMNEETIAPHLQSGLDGMNKERETYKNERVAEEIEKSRRGFNSNRNKEYTPEQIEEMRKKGQTVVSDSMLMPDREEIGKAIDTYVNMGNAGSVKPEKDTITQWLGKFFKGDKQDKYNMMQEKIDSMLQKPAELLTSLFGRVDTMMHKMVFGESDKGNGVSFFSKMMASIDNNYKKVGEWMNTKVMIPIKDAMVGENGLITQIKESQLFQDMKDKMKNFGNFMFGKEGSDGKRRNGLLGNTGNEMLDMWDGFKYYFAGNPYTDRKGIKYERNEESVMGQIISMGKNVKDSVKEHLFGDKESDNEMRKNGVVGGVLESLGNGFTNFKEAIFGPSGMTKENTKMTFESLKETVKAKLPKSIAWGGAGLGVGALMSTGLLGSLILPGGPFGAALVGSALGFASQSERFTNFMFGEKDARGERLGGFISSKMQNFFSKNKATLIGGAAIGSLNLGQFILPALSFGLLPAMTMGPLFGAVTGMGIALAARSETMQNFLFGKQDEDGKRTGGMLAKFAGKMKGKDGKNLFGNMGAGAIGGAGLGTLIGQFGLMGLAFGPVTGAIGGAVAGIALTEDKWKKALFGEWDVEAGARKGGVLGKFVNFMQMEVVKPFGLQMEQVKLSMGKWFTKSIANPFSDAIDPMKQAFKNMTSSLEKFFVQGWDNFKTKIGETFEEHVGKPFGIFMKEQIMDPMKSFFSKLLGGLGKILKPIAEMPIKMLTSFSNGFIANRQEARGVKKMREAEDAKLAEQKEQGLNVGLFTTKDKDGNVVGNGRFGAFKNKYFNSQLREEAKYSEEGAWYNSPEEKARRKKRDDETDAEYEKRQAELDAKKQNLDKRRRIAFKYDFDNFTPDGQALKFVYRNTKKVSRFKESLNNEKVADVMHQTISHHTGGVTMAEILGREGEEVDPNSLSKKDSKLLKKALKLATGEGIVGDSLRKYLNLTPKAEAKSEEVSPTKELSESVSNALEKVADVSNVKEFVAPKIETTNQKLSELIQIAKDGLINLAVDEGGFIKLPGGNKVPKQVNQAIETVSVHEEKREAPVNEIEALSKPKEDKVPKGRIETDSKNEDVLTRHTEDKSKQKDSKLTVPQILTRIMEYTRKTAQEIDGQLDGVGSNVFKIRKIIQGHHGVEDEDMKGSANRDRVGFWGHVRRAVFFKPLEAIQDKIQGAFNVITDKVVAIKDGIVNFGKNILGAFDFAVDTIKKGVSLAVKGVGKVLKFAFLDVPLTIGKGIAKGAQVLWTGFKKGATLVGNGIVAIGKGIIKGAKFAAVQLGKLTSGFFTMGKKLLEGAGSLGKSILVAGGKITVGLAEGAVTLTKGLWRLTQGIRNVGVAIFDGTTDLIVKGIVGFKNGLIGTGKFITKNLVGATKQLVSWSASTIKNIGNTIGKIGKSLLNVISSPFKWMAGKAAKWAGLAKQEVVVVGGTLDYVKEVGRINRDSLPEMDSKNGTGLTIAHFSESIYDNIAKAVSRGIKMAGHNPDNNPTPPTSPTSPDGTGPVKSTKQNSSSSSVNPIKRGGGIKGAFNRTLSTIGRAKNASGRLGGSLLRTISRSPLNSAQSLLARGTSLGGRFVGHLGNMWRGGVAHFNKGEVGTGNSLFSQDHPGSTPANNNSLDAVHALNSIGHSTQSNSSIGSGLVGLLGGIPSHLANVQRPVMDADIEHKHNTRRTAAYELEQIRIKQEREFLHNYRVTTMTHLENLDDNVFEILEILRKWPHCCNKDLPNLPLIPPVPPVPVPTPTPTPPSPVPKLKIAIPEIKFKWPALPKWNWPALPSFSWPKLPFPIPIPFGIPGKIPSPVPVPVPGRVPTPKPVPVPKKVPNTPSVPKKVPVEVPDEKPRRLPNPIETPDEKPGKNPKVVPLPKKAPVPDEVPAVKPKTSPKVIPFPKPTPVPDEVPKKLPDVAEMDELSRRRNQKVPRPTWKELLKSEAGYMRTPGFSIPESLSRQNILSRLSKMGNGVKNFFNFKQDVGDLVDDTSKIKPTTNKAFNSIRNFGSNVGSKLIGARNYVVDGSINRMTNSKLGQGLNKFANSSVGKATGSVAKTLGSILGPVFGTVGATKENLKATKTFGVDSRDDLTSGQKFAATVGGFLTNGTLLALPKLINKDLKDEDFVKELYSLKDPKDWWKKYGKPELSNAGTDIKNIFKPSTWEGNKEGAREGLLPKLWKETGIGGVLKSAAGSAYKGGQEVLFGSPTAIKDGWSATKKGFSSVGDSILDAVMNPFGKKASAAEKDGSSKNQRAVNNNTNPFASRFTTSLGLPPSKGGKEDDFTKKATEKAKSVWEGLTKKTNSAFENMSKDVGSKAETMKTDAGKKWKSMTTSVASKTKDLVSDTSSKWDDVKKDTAKKLKDIKSKTASKTKDMFEDARDKWEDVKKDTSKKLKDIKSKTATKTKEMYEDTREKWDDMKKKVGVNWKDLTSKAKDRGKEMWEDTRDKWDDMKKKVGVNWKDLTTKAKTKAKEMWEDTRTKWDDMKKDVGNKWKDLTSKAKGRAKEMWEDTRDKWDDMKKDVSKKWTDTTGKVKTKAKEIWNDTKDKWDDAKSEVSKKWTEMKKKAPGFATGVFDAVKGLMHAAAGAVAEKGQEIAEKVKDIWGGLFGKGKSLVTKSKDAVSSAITAGKNAVSNTWSKVKGFFGGGEGNAPHGGGTSPVNVPGTNNGMVYYSQNDKRWANQSYGGQQTMGDIGCAPTSAAMVVSSMTGKKITPTQMAAQAVNGGYVNPQLGTHKNFFTEATEKFGVKFKEAGKNELVQGLTQNKPIILRGQSEKSGPFTKNGHYLVATGMTNDGKILVNDPLGKNRSKAYDPKVLLSKTTSSFIPEYTNNIVKDVKRTGKLPAGNYGAGVPTMQANKKGAQIAINPNNYGGGTGVRSSGPFKGEYVTSDYGSTSNPTMPKNYHTGIDLVDPKGDKTRPIKSYTNGTVVTATSSGAWGNLIVIRDENGYDHYYAHMSTIGVRLKQNIKQGSVIGRQGNTGRVFGSNGGYHLHYEVVKPGKKHGQSDSDVNPEQYLSKYKGSKSFIGELVSGTGAMLAGAASTIGTLTSKAMNGVADFLTDTFNIEGIKEFKLLGEMTKAFGIMQANAFLKEKQSYAAEEGSSDTGQLDYSNVDYGATVRKYDPKKLFKGPYADVINKTAKKYNIEPQLLAAIIKQESNFNPSARSHAGATGLMQLMPGTARGLGVTNSLDPAQNVNGGAKYISSQLRSTKSLKNALMAYNWGPGNASRVGYNLSMAPTETRNYVPKIIANLEYYRKQVGGGFGGGTSAVNVPTLAELPFGGGSLNSIMSNSVAPMNLTKLVSSRAPEEIGGGEGKLRSACITRQYGGGQYDSEMIEYLKQIADNTRATSEGVADLKDVQTQAPDVKVTNVQANNNQNSYNSNPMIGAMNNQKNNADSREYANAKSIAKGR